jgi:Gpi18-like mannosyltransferase
MFARIVAPASRYYDQSKTLIAQCLVKLAKATKHNALFLSFSLKVDLRSLLGITKAVVAVAQVVLAPLVIIDPFHQRS